MENSNISISVITIVKDNEDLLPRAIESVLNQVLPDLEYIIVNDGSTDGTSGVIDSYANSDQRVKAVHLPECLGRSMARNAGMDAAAGRYLFFLDADDYVPEKALGILLDTADNKNADIVYAGTKCFDSQTGKWISKHYTDDIVNSERHNIRLDEHLSLVNNNQIVGRLYRKEMLEKHCIRFSTVRRNGEDVLFSFYTAFFAENISMLPSSIVYFYSLGNYINTANESKLNDARENLMETILYAQDNGSDKLQRSMWRKGSGFAADLSRAVKVYKGDDVSLVSYMKTLKSLIAGVDENLMRSLSPYQRAFVNALSGEQYINAYITWHESINGRSNIAPIVPVGATTVSGCVRMIAAKLMHRLHCSRVWPLLAPVWRIVKKFRSKSVTTGNGSVQNVGVTVSVIIPVYDVEEFLRQCLASVVSQTLSGIEIICVNDCSPDRSQSILDEYAEENDSFMLLTHDKNKGLSAARNTGLQAATGQYIYFLDSDDFLARDDAIELLYSKACADGADEVIGGILKWHEHTGEKYLDWHKNYLKKEVRGERLINLPELRCNVVAVNKLIKRNLLDENDVRFSEALRKHEDNPFSCKVHILTEKISIMPLTTYIYRQARSGSITNDEKKEDADYKNSYCSEIFSFIESNEKHHQFRDMYYPMYTRQLILGAGILSRFSPTETEKRELMEKWAESIDVMPENLPGVPEDLRKILSDVLSGKFEQAWDKAVLL